MLRGSDGIPDFMAIVKQETGYRMLRRLNYLRYYRRWKACLRNPDPLYHEIPWINFPAIDYLRNFANKSMRVFEYGSGGSTLFWAKRVKQVISVEHDAQWAKKIATYIHRTATHQVTLHHISPEPAPDFANRQIASVTDCISDDSSFQGMHFEKYVNKILDFPDNYFDVVVVDGRARPSCLNKARKKVSPTGIIVVDNTEREYYLSEALPFLEKEGWKQIDFFGPVPYLRHFCKTTVFTQTL